MDQSIGVWAEVALFVAYADSQVGQLFRAFVLIGPFHFQMMRYAGRTDYFFRSNIALGICHMRR